MATPNGVLHFISDNREFLTSTMALVTLLLKILRDYFVGKKKDIESLKKEETAIMERKQLKNEVQRNTALTVHVLNETAKSQGKTIDDIIMRVDDELDDLLDRINDKSAMRLGYDRERTGERNH